MKTSSRQPLGGVCAIPRFTTQSVAGTMQVIAVISCLWVAEMGNGFAQEARFFRIVGPVPATITSVAANGTVTWTNPAVNATFTVQVATTLTGEMGWADYVRVPVTNAVTAWRVFDPAPPPEMVLIPAGTFTMGDALGDDLSGLELPLHDVYVSGFYMDKYEVTKALWDEVKAWSENHAYVFYGGIGSTGKAPNHPVPSAAWWYFVEWCNARSEKEGLAPAYYADAGLTVVLRTEPTHPIGWMPYVNWNANGYRLPTEAEWEKAARGGISGNRFPWGDTNVITHSRANYSSAITPWGPSPFEPYDFGPTSGPHPAYNDGVTPFTNPVGSFAPNGYGLYDMAGNVAEMCWDWFELFWYSKPEASLADPQGPSIGITGITHVVRGGSWADVSSFVRCAYRDGGIGNTGFRCARRP